MIPIHIIVDIILSFTELKQWVTARTLNREALLSVKQRKYLDDCWGRATFHHMYQCAICNKHQTTLKWLAYPADGPRRRFIGHCDTWYCHISAIKSMLSDYEQSNISILRKPWRDTNQVAIPRSDGTTSSGKAKLNFLVVKNGGTRYVHVEWEQNGENYTKIVPLDHYTQTEPKYLAI